jgi:hypothetical protein
MQTDQALKDELVALEKQYWTAIRERDSATAMALSEDPCVVVGPQGVSEIGSAALGRMLEAAPYEIKSFNIQDVHVRRLSHDIVALAYKVKEELLVEGKKVSLDAFDSSVWQRRNGRWVCALHTESLAGDPFGRD